MDCTCFITSANDMASSMPGMEVEMSVKKEPASAKPSIDSISVVSGVGSTSCFGL